MLGLVPFHFWYIDVIGVAILPVSGFLTIVPCLPAVACLMDGAECEFFPVWPVLKPVLVVFALLSVGFGVIGANAETNYAPPVRLQHVISSGRHRFVPGRF